MVSAQVLKKPSFAFRQLIRQSPYNLLPASQVTSLPPSHLCGRDVVYCYDLSLLLQIAKYKTVSRDAKAAKAKIKTNEDTAWELDRVLQHLQRQRELQSHELKESNGLS